MRIQILAGPRQVGKTTLVAQLLNGAERPAASRHLASADPDATIASATAFTHGMTSAPEDWVTQHWREAERKTKLWDESGHPASRTMPFVLALDEIQHVPQWAGIVKGLWESARARGIRMHVVLLGSAPLLVQQGLTESLLGRYELLRMGHWSFEEMNHAFGLTLDQYLFFGGFPGSAAFIGDEMRWRDYVRYSLIEPNIQRDVLAMSRVDKPALLRQLFELGCAYSGQPLSLVKVRGRLGGHTDTLAYHLTLLAQAGLLTGLHKYAGQAVRQRDSPPKFQVHNNALMSATSTYDYAQAQADRSHWGRLVESAVGAHLINTADSDTRVHYWRERDMEVDFVVEHRGRLAAIEVKSRPGPGAHRGTQEFCRRYPDARHWLVGSDALPLGEFLRQPAAYWTR